MSCSNLIKSKFLRNALSIVTILNPLKLVQEITLKEFPLYKEWQEWILWFDKPTLVTQQQYTNSN